MEFRQLQYAVQIAAEKSFSRAAEKLHIAQPSLSQQLAKLEKELGVLLFQRNTNTVDLTFAGKVFIEKAQKILDLADQLKVEISDIAQMRAGKLTIGSLPITGSHILPLVLPEFRQKYPNIEIVLVEDTSTNLEHLTANGKTDLSILSLPFQEKSLTYRAIAEEEIWLAVPPRHPLAASPKRTVQIQVLHNEPFIVLKKGQGFRQITLDLCKHAGFIPQIVFESSNIETVQSLVAAGMGIAFVPMMVARKESSDFVPKYLQLEHPQPTRTLVVAYRKGRYLSNATEAFIQTLLEVMQSN